MRNPPTTISIYARHPLVSLALPLLLGSTLFSGKTRAETVTGVVHTQAANPLNVPNSAGRRTIAKEIKMLFGKDEEMLFYFSYSKDKEWQVRMASVDEHIAPGTGEIDRVTLEDESGVVELDRNKDGIWTSAKTAGFSAYDSKTKTLRFSNGMTWYFGCLSAPGEPDHGKRYLTVFKQTNGDHFTIQYQNGRGTTLPDSSSRITQLSDQRGAVYSFVYKTLPGDRTLRLIEIINNMAASTIAFEYSNDSPRRLRSLTNSVTGQSLVFEYTASSRTSSQRPS